MIHSLMLVACGLTMLLWRPCRRRAACMPALAVALLLLSAAAVWVGSFGVVVGVLSGRLLTVGPQDCGALWRQLIAGHVGWWQGLLAAGWVAAVPARGAWAFVAELRRTARTLRTFRAVGTQVRDPAHGAFLVMPGLATPAMTVGLGEQVVAVDERFFAGATEVERAVVLAHERAHVRGRHAWAAAAGRLLTAGITPLVPAAEVRDCLRRHLEALADDYAARLHGRQAAGFALGRIALAASPASGLGAAGASLWRVQRLLGAERRRRRDEALLAAMLVMLVTGLVLGTAETAHALGPPIDAVYCPLR